MNDSTSKGYPWLKMLLLERGSTNVNCLKILSWEWSQSLVYGLGSCLIDIVSPRWSSLERLNRALIVHHMECLFCMCLVRHKYDFFEVSYPKSCFRDQDHGKSSFSKYSSNVWAQKCTFSYVLNNVCYIPLSQLPFPCIKRDIIYVYISKEVYLVGLDECKHPLHRRILLTKWDKPLAHLDLFKNLDVAWKHLINGRQFHLAKGSINLFFLL